MLRFIPDSWLEVLLRPFIMADPLAGIYYELAAPDWRFAGCLVLSACAWFARTRGPASERPYKVLVLGLFLQLYVWTCVTGNGRYFMSGLLLIGPLLVAAAMSVPTSAARRWSILAGFMALQAFVVHDMHLSDPWGLVRWGREPLPLPDFPLRHEPAVFLSLSSISYSLLVPLFHPQSRWANVVGQTEIMPSTPEHARLLSLLASPLPKYVVLPALDVRSDRLLRQGGALRYVVSNILARHGLALADRPCVAIGTPLSVQTVPVNTDSEAQRGFWFCPVRDAPDAAVGEHTHTAAAGRKAEVFEQIERRCPRFFPPRESVVTDEVGFVMRQYPASDMRVYVNRADMVFYMSMRSHEPAWLGTAVDVAAGRFAIDCSTMPGRYRLPWLR